MSRRVAIGVLLSSDFARGVLFAGLKSTRRIPLPTRFAVLREVLAEAAV